MGKEDKEEEFDRGLRGWAQRTREKEEFNRRLLRWALMGKEDKEEEFDRGLRGWALIKEALLSA